MRKHIFIMSCFVLGFITLCTVAYYQSYKKAVDDRGNIQYKTKEPKRAVAVSNDGQRISAKCEMTTINHEISDDSEETVISQICPEYVGMTLEELNDRLVAEEKEPSLEELNKGFVRASLLSFDSKQISIIRYYSKNFIPDKYYMILEDEYVKIYYADKKTVFENTGITKERLRADEIAKLNEGMTVKDEHTLFSILEGYTS